MIEKFIAASIPKKFEEAAGHRLTLFCAESSRSASREREFPGFIFYLSLYIPEGFAQFDLSARGNEFSGYGRCKVV